MRVLVIEDDEELAGTVAAGLRHARIAVDVALDGQAGLTRALVNDYDVIVLDHDLPGIHGDEVCAKLLAAGGRSRVLMLTGAAENEDLVDGLGPGADDYLPKPFDFPVLVARIGALARRAQLPTPPVLEHGDVVLDAAKRHAHRGGRELELTPKEFGALELLLVARGRGRLGGGAARTRVGRERRPVHGRRADHDEPAAREARRSPRDRDRREGRLPHRRAAMEVAHRRLAAPAWLRLPRRTARLRLTALYGGLFLVSGVALVVITYGLFERATEYKTPHLPKVPHTSAIQHLHFPYPPAPSQFSVQPGKALPEAESVQPLLQHPHQLAQAQQELGQAQQELAQARPRLVTAFPAQLGGAQHQLTQGQHQLADAVHQLARVGPVQAAQRAADSHQLLVNSGIALAIVAVLALLAGWLVAGRMLRPIRTITRTARRISSTSLHERLASTARRMSSRSSETLSMTCLGGWTPRSQRNANASHELRAPPASSDPGRARRPRGGLHLVAHGPRASARL